MAYVRRRAMAGFAISVRQSPPKLACAIPDLFSCRLVPFGVSFGHAYAEMRDQALKTQGRCVDKTP